MAKLLRTYRKGRYRVASLPGDLRHRGVMLLASRLWRSTRARARGAQGGRNRVEERGAESDRGSDRGINGGGGGGGGCNVRRSEVEEEQAR